MTSYGIDNFREVKWFRDLFIQKKAQVQRNMRRNLNIHSIEFHSVDDTFRKMTRHVSPQIWKYNITFWTIPLTNQQSNWGLMIRHHPNRHTVMDDSRFSNLSFYSPNISLPLLFSFRIPSSLYIKVRKQYMWVEQKSMSVCVVKPNGCNRRPVLNL